jgi:hypothetical protein
MFNRSHADRHIIEGQDAVVESDVRQLHRHYRSGEKEKTEEDGEQTSREHLAGRIAIF